MRREKKRTVAHVAMQRAGFRKAYRVLVYAACWGIVEAEKGGPIEQVEEYATRWNLSRAQAFREQAIFRECFPEYATPRELLEAVALKVVPAETPERAIADLMVTAVPS